MAIPLADAPNTVRRLTVDEVIRMADADIIGETERVELVDGWLVEMSPEGVDHAWVVGKVNTLMARRYPEEYRVGSQSTLPLAEHTYLEPDVYVVRPSDRSLRWPRGDEVVLVVEVARTSARRDRTQKAALYAAWGAGVYWVVDLNRREVVVHADPRPDGYATISTHAAGEVELPTIDARIPIDELLPPA